MNGREKKKREHEAPCTSQKAWNDWLRKTITQTIETMLTLRIMQWVKQRWNKITRSENVCCFQKKVSGTPPYGHPFDTSTLLLCLITPTLSQRVLQPDVVCCSRTCHKIPGLYRRFRLFATHANFCPNKNSVTEPLNSTTFLRVPCPTVLICEFLFLCVCFVRSSRVICIVNSISPWEELLAFGENFIRKPKNKNNATSFL